MNFGSQNPYVNTGGGGFVQGSTGGYGSQTTPGGGERKAVNNSLRPVNIAQIYLAEQAHHADGEYTLEGQPVTMVKVVAQALSITAQTTSDVYKLDDGSGEIEARHWVDSRGSDDMDADMEDSLGYYRVIGTIRTYQNRRHINATIIQPITDHMETFFHFNEVMAATMFHKHGPPGGASVTAPAGNYAAGKSTTNANSEYLSHLGPVENAIITFFNNYPSGPDGHHVKHILGGVKKVAPQALGDDQKMQFQLIATAIDSLTGEGLLFSTLDDQHYALCT